SANQRQKVFLPSKVPKSPRNFCFTSLSCQFWVKRISYWGFQGGTSASPSDIAAAHPLETQPSSPKKQSSVVLNSTSELGRFVPALGADAIPSRNFGWTGSAMAWVVVNANPIPTNGKTLPNPMGLHTVSSQSTACDGAVILHLKPLG